MSELPNINYTEIVWSSLASDACLIINKKLLLFLELETAAFLSDLLSKERYFGKKNQLVDGWFFNSQDNVNFDTKLSAYKQKKATDILVGLGVLESERRGTHGRKWYKINHEKVFTLFLNFKKHDSKSLERHIINNNLINNKCISKDIQTTNSKNSLIVENESPLGNTSKFIRKKKLNRKRTPSKGEPRISGVIKKDTPKKESKPHPLVEYWNNISWTRIHKNPQSKTYQNAAKLLNQLKAGTFFKGKKFDQQWLERLKGSQTLLHKKFTPKEIKTGLDNVALFLKEGYEPKNKEAFPKSLEQLLYNPYSMKSQFLRAFLIPPKPLSETAANPFELDQPTTDKFLTILYGGEGVHNHKSMPKGEYFKLVSGVNGVIEYYDRIRKVCAKHDFLKDSLTKKEYFIEDYIKYLMYERYSNIEIKPYMIGPDSPSKNWDGFLTYLAQRYWDGNAKDGAVFKKS